MAIGVAALVVSIAGWIVSHALTLRAQRRQFLNSVLNEARKDIVKAIRSEQSRLGDLSMAFWSLELLTLPAVDWTGEAAKLERIRAATTGDLTIVLEEYENLFPKTARCRGELVKERMSLYADAGRLTGGLRSESTRREALMQARAFAARVQAFTIALDDLRVHVQNDTLGRITGNRAPRRRLKSDRLQIVLGDDGHLALKQPNELPAAETR